MIGFTKGYILRNVTAKTKGLQHFLDDVNKLDLRAKSESDVRDHLDGGGYIIALYQKDKLRGYYFFSNEITDCTGLNGYTGSGSEKCAVLKERFLGTGIPAETVQAIDEEIQGSFLEDIAAGRFKGMIFDDRYITLDRKPLRKGMLGGALFGIIVGAVVLFVSKNTWLSVLIMIAWGAAGIMISSFGEVNRQKENLRSQERTDS